VPTRPGPERHPAARTRGPDRSADGRGDGGRQRATTSHSPDHRPAALGGSLALVIPWFALGFALYAVAFAAAGALASKKQDASTRDSC
jgi:hypothetical protein